ncbi:MAG: hypothetical protein QM691_00850 [Opitutaceae bacterium]
MAGIEMALGVEKVGVGECAQQEPGAQSGSETRHGSARSLREGYLETVRKKARQQHLKLFGAAGKGGALAWVEEAPECLFQALVPAGGRQPGMVSVDRERRQRVAGTVGMNGSRGPMVDAVDARIAEPLLEAVGVFSQIVQQAGEAGLLGGAEGGGEIGCQLGDFAQVVSEGLPFARTLRERISVGIVGGVGVVGHA